MQCPAATAVAKIKGEESVLFALWLWAWQSSLCFSPFFVCAETKTWKTKIPEYINKTLIKTDIFLLLFTLSFHLICQQNTGEKEGFLWTRRTLGSQCIKTTQCSLRDWHDGVNIIWKRSGHWNRCSLLQSMCLDEYLSSLHFYTVQRGLSQSRSWVCGWEEWNVIDRAICFPSSSAATHEQPWTSRAVFVMERGRREGSKRRGERTAFSCHC